MTDILFLGNCQINVMRGIARGMFPKMPCDFRTITPYWGTFDEDEIRARLAKADLVIAQAIANRDTPFNVDDVRQATRGQIVFMPYIYIDGIAGLEIVASKGRSVVKGAEAILRAAVGRTPLKVFEEYCAGRIDLHKADRVATSMRKLREKEAADCDIVLSDYIEATWRGEPALWAINHPTQHILFEAFRRLCHHVGWTYDPRFRDNAVAWDQRALPRATRALSPHDVAALNLSYAHDSHWYGQAHKLIIKAIKSAEQAAGTHLPVGGHPGHAEALGLGEPWTDLAQTTHAAANKASGMWSETRPAT
ncbi:WcbI family polysaccharide biosynthesis putative acetyltransferase [Loktanella sp. DJP18]|uniref:WcbI family polysaccharide biosynthesis putative acetyltransferase n=1 Tax=Loktanella sp. DJP18 TaxID=3409788 RepID=UPI003BB73BC9